MTLSHWRCPKCKRTFMNVGKVPDTIRCNRCGHEFDVSADNRAIEKLRAEMLAEAEAEWAARTPEQEAAWEAGRVARRQYDAEGQPPLVGTTIRSGPLAANERCPYRYVPRAAEQHPLRHWWHMGWTHEEFEPAGEAR
jgi:hypothetical protein